jgi:hypothetical protein
MLTVFSMAYVIMFKSTLFSEGAISTAVFKSVKGMVFSFSKFELIGMLFSEIA